MLITEMRVVNVCNVPFEQPFQGFRTLRKLMGKTERKDRDNDWPTLTMLICHHDKASCSV